MSKRQASTEASTSVPSKRRLEGDGDGYTENKDMDDDSDLDASNEADIGIIERISVKNFMCHNRLDIRLGPHVNFIIGRNGSGKSAVLTALVVGLSGKASVTNRESTVKRFIKGGEQTAKIRIKLRNRGPEAYKHDEYGDSIIVERTFSIDGRDQINLKSNDGKVISQKCEDLEVILKKFNIQLDSPVAILNQDTSRNFLNCKSPQDKYKFFLRATKLDQMASDYRLVEEQIKGIKDTIETKELVHDLEKQMIQRQQRYSQFRCYIARRAKCYFILHLNQRNYSGQMTFNHNKETIGLSVQPTTTNGEGTINVKSLSARERSLANVCFIMSLWDALESPFRCIDGLDVSKENLMHIMTIAKQQTHNQFIFVTPISMSKHAMEIPGMHLNIFHMPDPDSDL